MREGEEEEKREGGEEEGRKGSYKHEGLSLA